MKKTTITYLSGATGVKLEPSETYEYITNNEVWSKFVILGKNDKEENWEDTNFTYEETDEKIITESEV